MTDRATIGLSTAYAYAHAKGLPMSDVFNQFDIEDDRDAPDTPEGMQHAGKIPTYGPTTLTAKGAATRQSGDVIDKLAARRGGKLPARNEAITNPTKPSDIEFAAPEETMTGAEARSRTGKRFLSDLVPSRDRKSSKPLQYNAPGFVPGRLHYLNNDVSEGVVGGMSKAGTGAIEKISDAAKPLVGLATSPVSAYEAGQERYNRNMANQSTTDLNADALGDLAAIGTGELVNAGVGRFQARTSPELPPLSKRINDVIPGAIDADRQLNLGDVLQHNDIPVNVDDVRNNPLTLIHHAEALLNRENRAADQLLGGKAGQTPSAHGPTLMESSRPKVALTNPRVAKAAEEIDKYVLQRMNELSAAHGSKTGPGMISASDADTIKKELNTATKWDKIFGKQAMSSPDAVRNGMLAHYSSLLDRVGDTIPGYRDLNARRSALIHYRDNVLPPIVNATTGQGAEGEGQLPSRTKAIGNLATGAVRSAIPTQGHAGRMQMVRGALDLATVPSRGGELPTHVQIANVLNEAAQSNRERQSLLGPAEEHPAAAILHHATATVLDGLDQQQNATSDLGPSPIDYAAPESGEALPVGRRGTEDVQSAFGPLGPTATDVLPTREDILYSRLGKRTLPGERSMKPDFAASDDVDTNFSTGGAVPLRRPVNPDFSYGDRVMDTTNGGFAVRRTNAGPYTEPSGSEGVAPRNRKGARAVQKEEGRLPARIKKENPGFDPKTLERRQSEPIEEPIMGETTPDASDWIYSQDDLHHTNRLLTLANLERINWEAHNEMIQPERAETPAHIDVMGQPLPELSKEKMLEVNQAAGDEIKAAQGNPNRTTARKGRDAAVPARKPRAEPVKPEVKAEAKAGKVPERRESNAGPDMTNKTTPKRNSVNPRNDDISILNEYLAIRPEAEGSINALIKKVKSKADLDDNDRTLLSRARFQTGH